MKTALLSLAGAAAALLWVSGPASAAPFQPLSQRLIQLDQRINQGLRNGALTRSDADSLRVGIARIRLIEAQYRRGGIDLSEQRDLDRRFDNLARHVRVEGGGRAYRDRRSSGGTGNYRGGNYRSGGNYRDDGNSYADRGHRGW